MGDAQTQMQMQDPDKLASEHVDALGVIVDLINGDFQAIAEHTQQTVKQGNGDEENLLHAR